jgi:hypothetical protein
MEVPLPQIAIPRVHGAWTAAPDPFAWDWTQAVQLPPLCLADNSGPPHQQTAVRLCYNAEALFVHFDCADREIWGTYAERDDPIYDEEVVEIFIAPGAATPVDYYELEVSPNGVLLDVQVYNPTGDRETMRLDFAWDCPGLRWGAQRDDAHDRWRAYFVLPWRTIGGADPLPTTWRANFYRIERPRAGEPEFSCWSPTLTEPADFHKPARFGVLTLLT